MIDNIELPNLILYKFLFNLEFLEDAILPEFKGSTLRGAFGWHLKKAVDNLSPVYKNIFETQGGENDISYLKGVKNIPHPFVLHPPYTVKRKFSKGEILTVGITLFGYAHNFLPFLIEAFSLMGKSGLTKDKYKFILSNVLNEDFFDSNCTIYSISSKLNSNYKPIILSDIIQNIDYNTEKIKLNFLTPFLLQSDSKEIHEYNKSTITPALIVGSIERRYKILSQYFCRSSTGVKEIFKPDHTVTIAGLNVKDYILQRFSSRLNEKQIFEGLQGDIILEGNLKTILPIIYIGEKINIGKKTSFGWGQYKIEILG